MARRKGRVLPFRAASSKPLDTKPLTDAERLLWQRFISPAKQLLAAAQQSVDTSAVLLIEQMMKERGLKEEDGWQFHQDKLRWERRPRPAEDS